MSFNDEVFAALKGCGYIITMYDDNGMGPIINPDYARYLFAANTDEKNGVQNLMIRMPDMEDHSTYDQLTIYKTMTSENMENLIPVFKTLKKVALQNGCTITIKEFSGKITPKRFASDPLKTNEQEKHDAITESFKPECRAKIVVKILKDSKENRVYVYDECTGEHLAINENNKNVAKAIKKYLDLSEKHYLTDDVVSKINQLGYDIFALDSIGKNEFKAFPEVEDKFEEAKENFKELLEMLNSEHPEEFYDNLDIRPSVLNFSETYLQSLTNMDSPIFAIIAKGLAFSKIL